MYCKEPGGRKLKDRWVNPRSASPSFRQDKSSRLFPSPRRRRRKRRSCLRLAFLRHTLSLSLSLSCVVSPFFPRSEKKRLAFCGTIQIAVCARSFSASEEYFFIVVFFVYRKKKKKKKKKKSSVQQQQQQRGAADRV